MTPGSCFCFLLLFPIIIYGKKYLPDICFYLFPVPGQQIASFQPPDLNRRVCLTERIQDVRGPSIGLFQLLLPKKTGARPVRVSGDHPVLPHEKQPELGATMELPRPQLGRDQYPQCWICLFDWPIGIRHRPKSSPFIRSSLKVAPEVVDQQHRHSWFILARCAGGSLLRDCCMVRGRGMEARAVVEKRKLRI